MDLGHCQVTNLVDKTMLQRVSQNIHFTLYYTYIDEILICVRLYIQTINGVGLSNLGSFVVSIFAAWQMLGMLLDGQKEDDPHCHPSTRESNRQPHGDTRKVPQHREDDNGEESHRCKSPTKQYQRKTCPQQECTWSTRSPRGHTSSRCHQTRGP